jgi:tetrahydromethanopterin S-methyltransferase subunit G
VIEMMNARFEAMERANIARFEAINHRFEEIDKRFEAMEKANIARFEAINQRFESLEKRLSFMQWLIGGGVLLVALKLFFPHIFPH